MKKVFILFISILFYTISFAQKKETFDIATFKVPNGWKKEIKAGLVNYTITNEAKKTFCSIGVYASDASSGLIEQEFSKYWNELVAVPFAVKELPIKDTATDADGREVRTGAGTFIKGSLSGMALLTTYVGFGRTTNVLAMSNNQSYYKDIGDFLNSLSIAIVLQPVSKSSVVVKPNVSIQILSTPSNNLEGVWMALHSKKLYMDKETAGNLKWISFFKNGRVAKVLPDDGMEEFNKNDKNNGYYSITNNKASLQWFKDVAPSDIKFWASDKIEFQEQYTNDIYYKCKVINNARLDGTWTSYNNINDPDLNDASKNRSMIAFKKDGSFIDCGIFAEDIFNAVPAGNGSYQINNFTLTLNYNTGVVKKTGFTGSFNLDVTSNSLLIYIHRLAFHKKN